MRFILPRVSTRLKLPGELRDHLPLTGLGRCRQCMRQRSFDHVPLDISLHRRSPQRCAALLGPAAPRFATTGNRLLVLVPALQSAFKIRRPKELVSASLTGATAWNR